MTMMTATLDEGLCAMLDIKINLGWGDMTIYMLCFRGNIAPDEVLNYKFCMPTLRLDFTAFTCTSF